MSLPNTTPASLNAAQRRAVKNLLPTAQTPDLGDSYNLWWRIANKINKKMRAVDIDRTPTMFFDPQATSSAGTGTLANPYYTAAQVQAAFSGDMTNQVLGLKRGSIHRGGLVITARGGINFPARMVPYGNSERMPEISGGLIIQSWSSLGQGIWAFSVAANQDVFQNGYRMLKKSTTYADSAAAIAGLVAAGPGTMGYSSAAGAVYIFPLDNENPNSGQMEITSAEYGLNFRLQNDQTFSGNVIIEGLHMRMGRNNALGWAPTTTNRQFGVSISNCIAGQAGVDISTGYASSAAISMNGQSITNPLTDWAVTDCLTYSALNNSVEQSYTTGGQVTGNLALDMGGNSIGEAYLACKDTEWAYNEGWSDPLTPSRLCVGAYSYGGFAIFGFTTGGLPDLPGNANVNNWVHHNLVVNAVNCVSMSGGANTRVEHNTFAFDRQKTSLGTTTIVRGLAAGANMLNISWTFNRNMVVNWASNTVGKHIDLQTGANPFPNPTSCDFNAYMMAANFRASSGAVKNVLRNVAADSASWIVSSGLDLNSIGTRDIDSGATSDQYGNWSVVDSQFQPTAKHPVMTRPAGPNLGYTRDINGVPMPAFPVAGCYAGSSSATLGNTVTAKTRTVTVTQAVLVTDSVVRIDATGGAVVLTLPPAAQTYNPATQTGSIFTFKKIDLSINAGNIMGMIDGFSQADLTAQYSSISVQSNGTTYDVLFRV